ncbi:NADH:ubiquinone/plastoquinone oxidoreductase, chain 6 [Artemisia annua]|uniref:NADH-ubiquinone oxidoreductase chain 6 n=1 Tax=Artemisia annua TaxID=35608 RepID=A0A2U1KNW6_ARTAN|nr:NADH:ubiquinone/plastoquinone oxidoreductase, chain 6 [Artemisia annua]
MDGESIDRSSSSDILEEGGDDVKEGRRTMILSVLSSLALVSGLMVVRAKNPVHSVLFPIPVFRNTSGLLLLLGLDFFAMIFPVVYIGAIAVSFLFVVMMFHIQIAEIHEEVLRYLPVSGIIGLIFWWEMFFILDNESIPLLPTQRNTTSLRYMVYAGKLRLLNLVQVRLWLYWLQAERRHFRTPPSQPLSCSILAGCTFYVQLGFPMLLHAQRDAPTSGCFTPNPIRFNHCHCGFGGSKPEERQRKKRSLLYSRSRNSGTETSTLRMRGFTPMKKWDLRG